MVLVRRLLLPILVAITMAMATAACGRLAGTGSSSGSSTAGPPQAPSDRPGAATVTRVVDGDTVVVRIGGHDESVRLIGIDTPESVKPATPVQCFALEASARTKALLPKGTPVRLEADVEQRDRYDRLLAYVYRERDDLFVNDALVQEGFAVPYTFPPNVAHAAEFVASAAAARRSGLGLWSRCGDDVPHHDAVPLPSPP
jgi:micrococcal nuclease